MSPDPWSPTRCRHGFTLIEVVGALVIFSMGVLMVLQVSGALGAQMKWAGARSTIVVLANSSLDSLEATPADSLSTGTTVDTTSVEDLSYSRTVTITQITPVLFQIDVTLAPVAGSGPSYSATSYTSGVW